MSFGNGPAARMNQVVHRSASITWSERHLRRLCERSFLSLWTYPSVCSAPGKELCDVLVVFREHVLIFSDKQCAFPDSDNLHIDWCRWFRRAIQKSAQQVRGAERRLRLYPNRLFLDHACKHPFPVALPDPARVRFHRVLVAHGAAERCRQALGAAGSLRLVPEVVGPMHYSNPSAVRPFVVGDIDPSQEFIHILDDQSLRVVMEELDTTPDFVEYLSKKEALFRSGKLKEAASEEDLLAYYLSHGAKFPLPSDGRGLFVNEGAWAEYKQSPSRKVQVNANELSYRWDMLIEKHNRYILNGTGYFRCGLPVSAREKVVQVMAAENRGRRRLLSLALLRALKGAPPKGVSGTLSLPTNRGAPCYLFLVVPRLQSEPESSYRERRLRLVDHHALVLQLEHSAVQHIVVIAVSPQGALVRSEDLVYFGGLKPLSQEDRALATRLHDKAGILAYTTTQKLASPHKLQAGRNARCPCGSGKKFKRCCGSPSGGPDRKLAT